MSKAMPSISVIIPTYNRVSVLERAINSVLSQTYEFNELIVVDDGSDDATQTLLKEVAGRDNRLCILQQTNKGVSAARNTGIAHASSDWLAFLDSDDEWLPNKLQTQVDAIEEANTFAGTALAGTGSLICHTEEIWVRNGRRVNQMNKHQKQGGDVFTKSLEMCAMSPSSIMIHHSIFDILGDFDETFEVCEDYDLWLRIAAYWQVTYVPEPQIIKYGGHEDQLSRRYFAMDQYRIRAIEKLLDENDSINASTNDNAKRPIKLSAEKREQAINTLNAKLAILLKGATKHNNQEILAFCKAAAQRSQNR